MTEDKDGIRFVDVPGWPRPKGYANGVVTTGKRTLYVAGQVGWNEKQEFAHADFAAYRDAQRAIGGIWRERFGRHFPVMALVGIAGLVEEGALVEIETTAALDEAG